VGIASRTSRHDFYVSVGAGSQTAVLVHNCPDTGDTVYRLHGGDSDPLGHSWTPENPSEMANPRGELGPPNGNSGELISTGQITDPEGIVSREALPLDGNPGGAEEWLIPNPESQIENIRTSPFGGGG
jgi:hypothetical protein